MTEKDRRSSSWQKLVIWTEPMYIIDEMRETKENFARRNSVGRMCRMWTTELSSPRTQMALDVWSLPQLLAHGPGDRREITVGWDDRTNLVILSQTQKTDKQTTWPIIWQLVGIIIVWAMIVEASNPFHNHYFVFLFPWSRTWLIS